jgi:hypothetical protein
MNAGRNAIIAPGLGQMTVPAPTIARQCMCGHMAIATASNRLILDGTDIEKVKAVSSRVPMSRSDGFRRVTNVDDLA